MYCVHRQWIDLQTGLVYLPFPKSASRRVNIDELVRVLVERGSSCTLKQLPWGKTRTRGGLTRINELQLDWRAFPIKVLYKDFREYISFDYSMYLLE